MGRFHLPFPSSEHRQVSFPDETARPDFTEFHSIFHTRDDKTP